MLFLRRGRRLGAGRVEGNVPIPLLELLHLLAETLREVPLPDTQADLSVSGTTSAHLGMKNPVPFGLLVDMAPLLGV